MLLTLGPLRRLLTTRQNDGVAAVEFALLAPVLLIALAGVVDLGGALYTRTKLETAVAAGANYALVNASKVNSTNGASLASTTATLVSSSNSGTPADAVIVVNNGPTVTVTAGTPVATGTATNANLCYCPTGSPPNWTWGAAVTCGNSCAGGGTAGKFVTVTASYNFTTLFQSYGFVSSGTITVGSAVQAQ